MSDPERIGVWRRNRCAGRNVGAARRVAHYCSPKARVAPGMQTLLMEVVVSWDISIVTNTGRDYDAHVSEVRNFTYNNGPILSALGLHPDEKDLWICEDWCKAIGLALTELPSKLEILKSLEPANKWGGIDDTVDMLLKLYSDCLRNPKAKVKWS